MFLICRSSTRITSNRRAMSVDGLLGPVFAPVPLPSPQPGDRALTLRAAVRAPRSAGERALQAPQPAPAPARSGPGQCSISPVDRAAETATPRSMPTAWPLPGAGTGRGITGERDMPAARRGPGSPGRTSRPAARRGTSGTAPTRPWAPRPDRAFGCSRRTSQCRPRRPVIRNPSSRPALRHDGRPAGLPGSKKAAIAWAKSRSACCWTVWEPAGEPRVLRPRGGELPALLQVTWRALPARAASAGAARRPGSTRTGRGRSGPAAPLPGRGWGAAGTATCEHTIEYRRHFRGGEAAFAPRPEGRSTTPRSR